MSVARRELLLSLAFAVWGLAIAIAAITLFERPAPPDQPMGLAKAQNFDAHGPLRWMAALMLLPLFVPLVLRPLARRLAAGRTWAVNAALIAPLATLWLVTMQTDVWRAIVPCAAVVALCAALRDRELHFSRRDAVLAPVFLTTLLALIDIAPRVNIASHLAAAAMLVLVLRLFAPWSAFLLAPLGLVLQTGFFARDERYFGWHALVLVIVTPFVLRRFLRDRRRATRIMVFVVFPLALFAYWNALSTTTAEGKPRANFFEDGHALLPASEYLRGERPYRDILPAHGLIEDGGFDAMVFATGEVTIGRTLKARQVVGTLTAVALYALAWAVTGSPWAALLTVLFSIMAGVFAPTVRVLPSVATLALIAAAVRWRRPRLFVVAGIGAVLCGATSLDYGFYVFATLLVAALRARAVRPAAIGLAIGVAPLFLALAAFGILDDFFVSTFYEIPAVSPAYTLGFFNPPALLAERRFFPEVVSALVDRRAALYLAWPLIAVFTGVAVVRRWPRRFEPVVPVGVFAVLAGISYAERHHLYFGMAAAVMLAMLIVRLRRHRLLLVAAAIVLANPTIHVAVIGTNRTTRAPSAEWVAIDDIPRARGAWWHVSDARAIASVRKYVDLSLARDETFFDFTNSGAYYFLFRRDCPIREYEVAFFQSEAAQREVIRRIESNPKVRAALVPTTPHGRITVDVPNAWRAPLVQQYLEQHFEPDFEEGEIAFWRRR